MASNGQLIILPSIDGAAYGEYPSGDAPALWFFRFDGANGDPLPAPLIELTGNYEIQNNSIRQLGGVPGGTIGSKMGMDTGVTNGTISCIFNANGSLGDEAGLMPAYIDADNFVDCIFNGGTLYLISVSDNVVGSVHASYAIPSYDNTADYRLAVKREGDDYTVYLNDAEVMSGTTATHNTATIWGIKTAGQVATFDDMLLPTSAAPRRTTAHTWVQSHSGFWYDGGGGATATDWTKTGTWMGWIASQTGRQNSMGGDFGQVFDFNDAWDLRGGPPTEAVNITTESTFPFFPSGTFSEQGFDSLIFTYTNYEQQSRTPEFYTPEVVEYLQKVRGEGVIDEVYEYAYPAEPDIMPGGVVDQDNLTAQELTNYFAYSRDRTTNGNLWWYEQALADVQNELPGVPMRLIPLGAVLADIWENESFMSTVTWTDLVGDGSPHGTEPWYLIMAIITWCVMYKEAPDLTSATLPAGLTQMIPEVENNLNAISQAAYNSLVALNTQGVKVF